MEELSSSVPQHKSIPELNEEYKKRIDDVLDRELTVDNIETFADVALNDVINIADGLIGEYRDNPELEKDETMTKREQEDDATEKLNLPNINEILELVAEKKGEIDSLKKVISTQIKEVDEIITPPDSADAIIEGGLNFKEKVLYPRLLTLMYILQNDLGISPDMCVIKKGEISPNMMRKAPYVRVEVPSLDRVVYICDEEGNATYIFDTKILDQHSILISELDIKTKDEKNELISNVGGVGIRVIQGVHWRTVVLNRIKNIIPSVDEYRRSCHPKSEIKRGTEWWLPFASLQQEARLLYPGEGSVQHWYGIEQKRHNNWPSNPNVRYEDSGWEGWSELVGKENHLKKRWPSFADFQQDVGSLYPGNGSVREWYKDEQIKHDDWPSNPDKVYGEHGWEGWPELVGKENRLKKRWPSFVDFQKNVMAVYGGESDTQAWYRGEQRKHDDWPPNPEKTYAKSGWEGWPNFVGKK